MYLIQSRQWASDDEGFDAALAHAYKLRSRPICTCKAIEMYIARVSNVFVVKRMPYTGSQHTPDCPHYEPPPEVSGLGQVLGSAIREDAETGLTQIRLGFSMSKGASRSVPAGPGEEKDSVASDGTQLSLRGLLHYLWDQAELTRWRPGFAGKRSWAVVRTHLSNAAQDKVARDAPLGHSLYVPETFAVERREEINARRVARFAPLHAWTESSRPLMLLIGELKEIAPSRFHHRVVIKHLPDQCFALDDQLQRRMARRFERELSLWDTTDSIRMILIGTFGMNDAGLPWIAELSLMPVTSQWIPVNDSYDQQLVERLVREERSFVKTLVFNASSSDLDALAMLLDSADEPVQLRIERFAHRAANGASSDIHTADSLDRVCWVWPVDRGSMPALPPKREMSSRNRGGISAAKDFAR